VTIFPDPPGYAAWEAQVPEAIKRDPIWRTPAYRFGLMIGDLAAAEAEALRRDTRTHTMADQLLRAVQSISTNLTEGYGHTTGRERARYYDYALTSALESCDWYYKVRPVLGDTIFEDRHALLQRIIRILTAIIPRERADRGGRRRRNPPPDS